MKKPDDIKQEIEKLVDEYQISHKGSAQCKCISGARGHLIAKLMTLVDRIREDERRKVYVDIKVKFDAWLIMPTLDADKMSRSIYKYLVEKVNSLTTKSL